MNAKQTKEDKIYVYSSFKQICLPVLLFLVLQLSTAMNCSYTNVYLFTEIVQIRKCWELEINH